MVDHMRCHLAGVIQHKVSGWLQKSVQAQQHADGEHIETLIIMIDTPQSRRRQAELQL